MRWLIGGIFHSLARSFPRGTFGHHVINYYVTGGVPCLGLCVCISINRIQPREAAESHSYIGTSCVLSAQSNISTCKHTESAIFTKFAYDTSSLAVSSVPTNSVPLHLHYSSSTVQRSWSSSSTCVRAPPSLGPYHHPGDAAGAMAPVELLPPRGSCAVGRPPCSLPLDGRDGVVTDPLGEHLLAAVQRRIGGIGVSLPNLLFFFLFLFSSFPFPISFSFSLPFVFSPFPLFCCSPFPILPSLLFCFPFLHSITHFL